MKIEEGKKVFRQKTAAAAWCEAGGELKRCHFLMEAMTRPLAKILSSTDLTLSFQLLVVPETPVPTPYLLPQTKTDTPTVWVWYIVSLYTVKNTNANLLTLSR